MNFQSKQGKHLESIRNEGGKLARLSILSLSVPTADTRRKYLLAEDSEARQWGAIMFESQVACGVQRKIQKSRFYVRRPGSRWGAIREKFVVVIGKDFSAGVVSCIIELVLLIVCKHEQKEIHCWRYGLHLSLTR